MNLLKHFFIPIFLLSTMVSGQIHAMTPHQSHNCQKSAKIVALVAGLGTLVIATIYALREAAHTPARHILPEIIATETDYHIEERISVGRIDWEQNHDFLVRVTDELAPFIPSIPDIVSHTVTDDQYIFLLAHLRDYGHAAGETTGYPPLFGACRRLMDTLRMVHRITEHAFVQRFQIDAQRRLQGPVTLVPAQDVPISYTKVIERAPLLEKNIRTLMFWLAKTPEMASEEHAYRAEKSMDSV